MKWEMMVVIMGVKGGGERKGGVHFKQERQADARVDEWAID